MAERQGTAGARVGLRHADAAVLQVALLPTPVKGLLGKPGGQQAGRPEA